MAGAANVGGGSAPGRGLIVVGNGTSGTMSTGGLVIIIGPDGWMNTGPDVLQSGAGGGNK
jgi:hypothetical protein